MGVSSDELLHGMCRLASTQHNLADHRAGWMRATLQDGCSALGFSEILAASQRRARRVSVVTNADPVMLT